MKKWVVGALMVFVPPSVQADTAVKFVATTTSYGVTIAGMCSLSTARVQTRQCQDEKPCNWMHAEVELESCTTKNSLRDKHMKKMLQVGKLPKAKLCAFIPMTTGPFKGELEISGKKSRVTGELVKEGSKSTLKFKTTLTQHGIERPSFLGVTVADEVEIEATIESEE